MVKRVFVAVVLSMSLISWDCNQASRPSPASILQSDPIYNTTPSSSAETGCKLGCSHLLTITDSRDNKIGCKEARNLALPLDAGVLTCEQYCLQRLKAGTDLKYGCLVNVSKCEDIEAARVKCN
jgi:hypothetical protein